VRKILYVIAGRGAQLPRELERNIRGEHSEGAIICAVLALVIANWTLLITWPAQPFDDSIHTMLEGWRD
jgi:hypothetical protein